MKEKAKLKSLKVSAATHKEVARLADQWGLLKGRMADTLLREALAARAKEASRG